jgi:hypothetical protein
MSSQGQDWFITGAAAQSVLNNNAILAVAGTSSIDTVAGSSASGGNASYAAFYCQLNGSAGIGAGQIIFQGSTDNVNFVALTYDDDAVVTGAAINAATAIAASTSRFFSGKLTFRYFRCRISTAFTGGTVQAFIRLVDEDYNPRVTAIANQTAANLQATAAISSIAAGTNLVGDVAIEYRANATGAASVAPVMSPVTPVGASIKGTAGRIMAINLQNSASAIRSVKFFNATSVTMGTTAATFEIDVPAGGSAQLNFDGGIGFATGIMWAVTAAKGLTDNTTTSLALADVSGVVAYA